MIVDYDQFELFLEILPELQKDEVYFVSLSTRKKYLTEEERVKYDLGRTEMFSRQVVRNKEQLPHIMRKLAAILDARLTKSNLPMPKHATVCYMNINPSSTIKAYQAFVRDMNTAQEQIINSLLQGKTPDFKAFQYLDRKLLNQIQKYTGIRYFLDIDCDTDNYAYVTQLLHCIRNVEHYVVETRGGWHIMINRKELNTAKIKLHEIVKELNSEVEGEIIFNNNAMIPVPGTLQAGYLVKISVP